MQRVGAYDLVSELGRGTMGVVYRARHRPTKADRALKLIKIDPNDPELVNRFKRESAALARVDGHPNIVRVHEAGVDGQHLFYAMELVEGTPLRKLMAEGPMRPKDALRIASRLARALGHCHAQGVIHRDVKPENVIVDENGEPRLIDFGLVRDLTTSRMTRSGAFIGTPAYMAAEQVRGEAAMTATDVYALGAILYEMLAGCSPYIGRTVAEIAQEIVDDRAVPLEARCPALPQKLVALVHGALRADPLERPRTAVAFARELEAISESLAKGTGVVAAGTHRRYALLFVAVGVAALLLVLAVPGAVYLRKWSETRDREALIQAARDWTTVAQKRTGAGPDAVLIARVAISLAEAAPEDARRGVAAEAYAAGAAAAFAHGTDADTIAFATKALALLPPEPAERITAIRWARARARAASGDAAGALDDLKTVTAIDGQRLEAQLLLQLERYEELMTRPTATDPICRCAQLWASYKINDDAKKLRYELKRYSDTSAATPFMRAIEARDARETLAASEKESNNEFEFQQAAHLKPETFFKPFREAADKLLGVWQGADRRFLDRKADLEAIEKALVFVAQVPQAFYPPVPGQDPVIHRREVAQLVEDLETSANQAAGDEESPDVLAIQIFAGWCLAYLPPVEACKEKDARRSDRLWAHADTGRADIDLKRIQQLFIAAQRKAARGQLPLEALLAIAERAAVLVPEEKRPDGWSRRANAERLVADVCVRVADASPDPAARAYFLDRAEAHVAIARASTPLDLQLHELIVLDFLIAMARGDVAAATEVATRFSLEGGRFDVSDANEYFLAGELKRWQGDQEATRKLFGVAQGIASADVDHQEVDLISHVYDMELAGALLGCADTVDLARADRARKLLADLDSRRTSSVPALSWIGREVTKVLGPARERQ
jgi:serine/threonine-protein kinase